MRLTLLSPASAPSLGTCSCAKQIAVWGNIVIVKTAAILFTCYSTVFHHLKSQMQDSDQGPDFLLRDVVNKLYRQKDGRVCKILLDNNGRNITDGLRLTPFLLTSAVGSDRNPWFESHKAQTWGTWEAGNLC